MKLPVVNTQHITREEWLKARRTGIGGSDASTIIGLNPYSSVYYLYNDKLGLLPEKEDSEAMRQGRDLEQYVADRWMERTGKKCRRNNTMWRSKEHPFMIADIDREVIGENAGLECKTTSVFNKSDLENGCIPETYYVQCMHYMAVMGFDRMYLAVLVLNRGFYDFVIERDEAEIEALAEREFEFWQLLVSETPPPLDGSQATADALKKLYPEDGGASFAFPLRGKASETAGELVDIQHTIRELQKIADEKKAFLMSEMGDYPLAETGQFTVRWKTQTRTSLDTVKLKKERPELYKQYAKTTKSRVFTIKENKEKGKEESI